MNLADALIPRSYKNGECIIKQGDAADGMYFIEDGTIRICILDEANKEVEVGSDPTVRILSQIHKFITGAITIIAISNYNYLFILISRSCTRESYLTP